MLCWYSKSTDFLQQDGLNLQVAWWWAPAVSTIEADDKTADEQLVAPINQWVAKDPKASWRELVDALNMCSIEAVASAISKNVGLWINFVITAHEWGGWGLYNTYPLLIDCHHYLYYNIFVTYSVPVFPLFNLTSLFAYQLPLLVNDLKVSSSLRHKKSA